MSQVLKNIFIKYKPKFESYVNNDFNLDNKEKMIVLEVLHYLDAVFETQEDLRAEKIKFLNDYQTVNYTKIEKLSLYDLAYFWAEKGFYCFKFKDAETNSRFPLVKSILKVYRFHWIRHSNPSLQCYKRKEGTLEFNVDTFLGRVKQAMDEEITKL